MKDTQSEPLTAKAPSTGAVAEMPRKARRSKSPEIKLRGHFIPNSHLDREWTLDYQQTRRLTVEFLDALLDIFDQIPEYTFLLDSQTVPIEDYLEIRPENEPRLRAAIQSGRMSIGPWYTAPDCNTISGESIIRNLLVGHRLARQYGKPMKTGYTPFGFGQVSQLPQIYTGFDIDTVFFYRGITNHEAPESEFMWESPDGTRVLCSRFGTKARYNFFMEVWRPVAYGRVFTERIQDWTRGGMPFKRVTEDREHDHYFILQSKKQIHREKLELSFRNLIDVERKHFTTPCIPFMQGMDTTRPDPLEAEIVRELQGLLEPGEELFFSTLEEFARDFRSYLDFSKLRVFKGEMRNCGLPSPYATGLEHIISGRTRQKIQQARSEKALIRLAEPFAAFMWALGGAAYPRTYLDLAWKYLLRSHPHDTVAGCGIDKLERDAHYRLDQVKAISDIVLDDALGSLLLKVDTSKAKDDELVVTVFNPSPRARTEVVDAYLDFGKEMNVFEFELVDASGKVVDFCVAGRKPSEKTVRDNCDLTMALVGWNQKTQFLAEDVPAYGWKTYIARRSQPNGRKERIASSPHHLENEHLAIDIRADGTFQLTDKQAGTVYTDLNSFIDEGENGNGWEWRAPSFETIVSSRGSNVSVSLIENTALSATALVRVVMRVPTGLIHDDTHTYARRGEKEVDLAIESEITLRKGARRVDIKTTIDNQARNHRLRACFPTNLSRAKCSHAETPCDVAERVIERDKNHSYSQAPNPQHPLLRFIDVSDGKTGLAILTEGLHEYEVTDDPSRTIRLTMLRAYEVTLCTVSWRWERRPDQGLSQQPGLITTRYSVYPHRGNWEKGEVMRQAEDFQLPLLVGQSGRNADGGPWKPEGSLCQISPAELVISAVKKAEDRDVLILRLHNSATARVDGRLSFPKKVASARLLNMDEIPVRDGELKVDGSNILLPVTRKKIVTVEVTFGDQGNGTLPRSRKSSK